MELKTECLSLDFITDAARRETKLDRPYLLVVDGKLAAMSQILGLLEEVVQKKRSLLVLADDVEGEALATLVVNKLRGTLRCCAIKATGTDNARSAAIRDLIAITGGRVLSPEDVAEVSLDELGSAEGAIVSAELTEIIRGARLN